MSIAIHNVANANVYADGNNWLGRCEEIRMPMVKPRIGEFKGLGMLGEVPYNSGGIEKMDADFTFSSLDLDVARAVSNPFKPMQIQVRASLERTVGGGVGVRRVPVLGTMYGTWSDNELGTFKKDDGLKPKAKLNLTYYKLVIDDETVLEYDAVNNILVVDGEDLFAELRRHLGA